MKNLKMIRILFLKDLFLSRWILFAYLIGGLASCAIGAIPNPTMGFISLILIVTVAVGAGMYLLGDLLIGEGSENTRSFIMSLPVSLRDYSLAKISVVLTVFMIPWVMMLAFSIFMIVVLPGEKLGAIPLTIVIFLELLAAFTVQLVAAAITESLGWTISVMVGCNVFFNVFLMTLMSRPEVSESAKSEVLSWPTFLAQVAGFELLIVVVAIAVAIIFQSRKRDLV